MIRTIECGIYILLAALSLSPILSFAKIVVKNKNTLRGLFAKCFGVLFFFLLLFLYVLLEEETLVCEGGRHLSDVTCVKERQGGSGGGDDQGDDQP